MGVFSMLFFILFLKRPDCLGARVILIVEDTGSVLLQVFADGTELLLCPLFKLLVKSFAFLIIFLIKDLFLSFSMLYDS